MKREQKIALVLLWAFLAIALASLFIERPVLAQSGPNAVKYTGAQHAVEIPFTPQSTTGASAWIWVGDTSPTKHAVQVDTTGSPASCTYNLEGSLDGTNASSIINAQACTTSGTLTWESSGTKPVLWVRFNLTALSASSTATAYYLGSK